MPEVERGVIKNRKFASQIRDFSGLRFGNITPTDIDGLIEYKNMAFIFIELKYKDAVLPLGQRLALERLCDGLIKSSLLIVASHDKGPDEDIDVAKSIVSEIRFKRQWHKDDDSTTTSDMIIRYLGWVEMEKHRMETTNGQR